MASNTIGEVPEVFNHTIKETTNRVTDHSGSGPYGSKFEFVTLNFPDVDSAGVATFAASANPIRAANTATATARRGSAFATPTGEESSVIKVHINFTMYPLE